MEMETDMKIAMDLDCGAIVISRIALFPILHILPSVSHMPCARCKRWIDDYDRAINLRRCDNAVVGSSLAGEHMISFDGLGFRTTCGALREKHC